MNFPAHAYPYRLPAALLLMLIFLLLPAKVKADAQGHVERTIVVGANRAYPPYEFLDKNGAPAGY
ncbi:MAG: hypothetical protein Q7U44_12630, partial [Desulfuromonadales bacterium]|nr:hypothetical protein [Desulfuromonadales bacterium]